MRAPLAFLVLASLLALPSVAATENVADLRLVKTALDDMAEPGDTLTFSLNVTNLGPGPATGIVVTDPLPPGTTFDGGAPNCSEAAGVITCVGEDLDVGASFGYSVSLRVSEKGNVTNTATVSHDGLDPDPSNNVSSATGEVVDEEPFQGVQCSASVEGNTIMWNRLGAAASFRILRSEGDGELETIAEDDASPFLDTNVTAGATYTYHVFAVRGDGSTGASGACIVTAIPEFPVFGLAALALLGSVLVYARLRRS